MLVELSIVDFAIIRETRLQLEPGFNALTGETGAGKSILIDALGAVLGERVGADIVRTGAKAARVEAVFDLSHPQDHSALAELLEELGVEVDDGTLILTREMSVSGRGSARVNGRAATAGMLSRLGAHLVDIHGQSDHLSLLRPAAQLDILDRFANLLEPRSRVRQRVAEWRQVRQRIAEVRGGSRERAQRVDLLRFQVSEIEAAALQLGEEESLVAERQVLANAERLTEDAATAYTLLIGDDDAFVIDGPTAALSALRQASDALNGVAAIDGTTQDLATRLAEVIYLVEDIAAEARDYRDGIEADPARLAAVEERLDLIKSLKRKYGATIDEILMTAERASVELSALTGDESNVDELEARSEALATSIGQLAGELSEKRRQAGERLARAVERTIAELNMGRARIEVAIEQNDDPDGVPFKFNGDTRFVSVDATGADQVMFLMAPNVGEALKPLGRVASGGETARLMLALKSILSAADETPTLVFDEVDVGVGGRSGQVVGEKLWGLSTQHQVLVITHLPQIAAFADAHFRISKAEEDERIVSYVEPLSDDQRLDELAAMLDGLPVTDASRANAEAMARRVGAWKGQLDGPVSRSSANHG